MERSHARGTRSGSQPRAQPRSQPMTRPQPTPPTPLDRRVIRVLVVDDDLDTRDVLHLILCPEEGFEMVGCGETDTCLASLRAATSGETPPFDVLLLDLMLPGGHVGTEILEICGSGSADAPHLPPVVVCTALSDAALAPYRAVLNRYGARVIRKPFGIEAVLAALRAAAGA